METGLYLIERESQIKNKIKHFAILDIGNTLNLPNPISSPLVVHMIPPKITAEPLNKTEKWSVISKITDIQGAKNRLIEAIKKPIYNIFNNNCEQVACFIAFGKKESIQIQKVVLGALLVLVIGALLFNAAKRA